MHCIKTGFHGYLDDYAEYVYGDAFIITKYGVAADYYKDAPSCPKKHNLLLRVCARGTEPMYSRLHIVVKEVDRRFDEKITSIRQNSTILVAFDDWGWLGYKGQPLAEVFSSSDNQIPS